MLSKLKRLYVGDRAFYTTVMALIIPIIIQSTVSNFVSLLDNLMVGAVGQNDMNGVAISNQLIFVFNITVFGGMSGATIFGAQFFGANDENGVRHCFRYAMWVALIVGLGGMLILGGLRDTLLGLYINPTYAADATEEVIAAALADADATLIAGGRYIDVMLWGLIPFAVSNAYASILRVTGETKLPMLASIVSVILNLIGNWILIFGKLGFPAMGAEGAAVATVISRYVEMLIMVFEAHRRQIKNGMYGFLTNAYASLRIPLSLLKQIFIKGAPLLANEFIWSLGMAALNRQYSLCGLDAVAAVNINSTINNIFNVFFFSMGTATSVMVGNALGANDFKGAKDLTRKLIAFAELLCLGTSLALFAASGPLPGIYTEATDTAKQLATSLMRVWAAVVPLCGFLHCAYFTLRAGGRTVITFFFDAGYTWIVAVPLAWALSRLTAPNIVMWYAIVSSADIIKVVIGYILLRKGVWIHNIVGTSAKEA